MTVEYKFKTLSPQTARLVSELNERRQSIFSVDEASEIMGVVPAAARNLLAKAHKRGVVTRLKPGLFNLVPFELGRDTFHVDNPYLIAHALVGGADYFISHGSAFELHAMVTQPQLAITVSSVRQIRRQEIQGYEFRFVEIDRQRLFGVTDIWIKPDVAVKVSDPERSIIDGLDLPQHVGGVGEVARALSMKKDSLSSYKLIEYALRLGKGAVIRRLGYLLELYDMAGRHELEALRIKLTPTFQRLDPLLPNEGRMLSRWRVRLNIEPDELLALRHA